MKNFSLLVNSLEYIELHISEDIRTDDIAAACFCSRPVITKTDFGIKNLKKENKVKKVLDFHGQSCYNTPCPSKREAQHSWC